MLFPNPLKGTGRLPGFRIFLSLLLLTGISVHAQQRNVLPQKIPRSPDAAAMEDYNNIPASESAGIAEVNIPLADLHVGSFALPISLRYHKNGLKVEEVPSSVGDGWTLHYGGMITFQQNGLHDFKTAGLFDGGVNGATMTSLKSFLRGHMDAQQRWTYLEKVINDSADAAFDEYQYSFLGKSGSYYYDTLMNAVTVPKNDIKIFRQASEIRILDNDNNNYYFGAVEQCTSADSSAIPYRPRFNDMSTYYLSRIVTKENRTILFRYRSYTYTVTRSNAAIHFIPPAADPSCMAGNGMSTYNRTEQIKYLLPDSIIFDQGLVKFSVSVTAREDLKTLDPASTIPSITGISIFAGNNKKIKDYAFTQGYFDTNKRLKLSGVQEYNGVTLDKSWDFSYYHENGTFPVFFSNDQDHWGYYNAAGNAGRLPDIDYSSLIPGWNSPVAGYGDRSSDTAAVFGMLQSVVYPAGGSTAFEYEPNQLKVGAYNELITLSPFLTVPGGTPAPYIVGGVRVKTIITNDSTGAPSHYRKYTYADSLQTVSFLNIPNYISGMESNRDSAAICVSCGVQSVVLDESIVPFKGSPIVYSHITVSDSSAAGKQGKTENTYLLPGDHTASRTAPYVPPMHTSWYLGRLQNRKLYALKNDIYHLIREYRYSYNALDTQWATTGFRASYERYCTNNNPDNTAYKVSLSTVFSDRFSLLQTKEIDYLPVQSLTRQTDYTVNATRHTLPSIETKLNSKQEQVNERTIYSFDYDTTTITTADARGIRNLGRLNVLTPVEKIRYKTIDGVDYVTGATFMTFREDRPYPNRIFQLNLSAPVPMSSFTTSTINSGSIVKDSRYELETTISRYDDNNNVIEKKGWDGIPVTYKYDYKRQYKVAEVLYATTSTAYYASFETDDKGGWGYSGTPVTDPTSPVGERCYDLSTGTFFTTGLQVPTVVLSYWTKNTTPFTFPTELPFTPVRGKTVNGWTYFMHWLSGGFTTQIVFPSSGFIDDVRLFPMAGEMTTYSYQPHTGVTSVCDNRGNITYYSYDETGRLKMVKDGEGRILKLMDYQYRKPITQ